MNTTDSQPSKNQTELNQATHVAIAIILVVAAMTTTAFFATFGWVPFEALIFVAGTVGGAVNSFRRIQDLSTAKSHESNAMTERLVTIQIYVSPFVGGIFAFVLYTIFMAELVQGSLFPNFKAVGEEFTNYGEFALNSIPKYKVDVAKAIVWAFIAGFSEGLVPNFISKITKDADKKNSSDS